MRKKLATAIAISSLIGTPAYGADLYSIYWMTDALCTNLNGGPLVSPYLPSCMIGNQQLSICPGTNFDGNDPYNQHVRISITGYQINAFTQDRNMQMSFLIGAHPPSGFSGGDMFASCAGTGSVNCAKNLSQTVTQGGTTSVDGNHIDIYGQCYGADAIIVHLVVLLEYQIKP